MKTNSYQSSFEISKRYMGDFCLISFSKSYFVIEHKTDKILYHTRNINRAIKMINKYFYLRIDENNNKYCEKRLKLSQPNINKLTA